MSKAGHSSKYVGGFGKQKVSGGFKPGNMNAFVFGGSKKKRKIIKRGK